ncbi:MAG: hypothetical protein ACFFF4_04740 [Candidatus Thorarchaeota archaeon]
MGERSDLDDFLMPKEKIEWSFQNRWSYLYVCGFTLIIFLLAYQLMNTQGFDPILLIVSAVYTVGVILVFIVKRVLFPPMYIITNKRIIRMRGKRITREVDRSRFGERPLKLFVGKRVKFYSSKDSPSPIYDITFYDPETSKPLIKFNAVDSVEMGYEAFYSFKECPSCGVFINEDVDSCLECGQSFL